MMMSNINWNVMLKLDRSVESSETRGPMNSQ